jgi:hypothetical protein
MCFIVAGHSGQKHKKADLSLKINFSRIFRSRFGFLVQFYPELEIKKYAQGQGIINFCSLFEKPAHCATVRPKFLIFSPRWVNIFSQKFPNFIRFGYFVVKNFVENLKGKKLGQQRI